MRAYVLPCVVFVVATAVGLRVTRKDPSAVHAASRVKVSLLELMKRQGFIRSFQPMAVGVKKSLRIYLKFLPGRRPAVCMVRRVSRPGLRQYCGADRVPHVINSRGIAVLSTSRGLMTDREARQAQVGGEVICYIS